MTINPVRIIKVLRSKIPTPLPVGMTAFAKWSSDIIDLCGPVADAESMRFALATMIGHLPPDRSDYPLSYFVKCLRKAAANQVAAAVFQDIKTRQAEAHAAAEAEVKNQVASADTSSPVPSSTGPDNGQNEPKKDA